MNDLHALISPPAPGTPLPIVLLGKSKNALLSTFLFLDQIVWLGRTGIYKNKERVELLGRISLYCWLSSSVCTTLVELGELGRLSALSSASSNFELLGRCALQLHLPTGRKWEYLFCKLALYIAPGEVSPLSGFVCCSISSFNWRSSSSGITPAAYKDAKLVSIIEEPGPDIPVDFQRSQP